MPTVVESSPPRRSTCRRWAREALFVWLGGWRRLWPRLWIILAAIAIGAVLVLTISPQDNALLAKIRVEDNDNANNAARFLSNLGDLKLAAPLAVLLWIIGAASDRVRWRKLGLALIMATLVSGGIGDFFRADTGRPRPEYQSSHPDVADTLHGPRWFNGDMQSFPSGHACVSAATGSTVLGISPLLAIPGGAYAIAVSWSRMQLNRHHPIDVAVGATIGTVCGLCFVSTVPGAWIRLKRRRKREARRLSASNQASFAGSRPKIPPLPSDGRGQG